MHLRIYFLYVVVSIGTCLDVDCGTQPGLRLASPYIMRKDSDKYAEPGEVPWQVQIWSNTTQISFVCGGVLLDNFHVLTAAHCMFNEERRRQRPGDLFVKVGHNHLNEGERYNVSEVILHPRHIPPVVHDIAVLKISSSITFSETVLPVCLPSQGIDLTNSSAYLSGWGYTSFDRIVAKILRVAKIFLVALQECKEAFPKILDFSGMLCAPKSKTVPCDGDSGGPLTQYNTFSGTWFVVGIVSFGMRNACTTNEATNSVYTDVTAHSYWIQMVQDGNPCASEPCQNGGICIRRNDNRELFTCLCNGGFSGENCEDEMATDEAIVRDPCANSPCHLNETCRNRNGVAVCRCKETFIHSGLSCIADPCNPTPCGPNSVCERRPNGTSICACKPGFFSDPPNCEPGPCEEQKCGIHTVCQITTHATCQCRPGYTGDPGTGCIPISCSADEFDCYGNASECVLKSLVCNCDLDCSNGEDEVNCTKCDFYRIYVNREEWNARRAKHQLLELATPVEKIIIAHSVTGNNPSDCGRVVRSIQGYHMYSKHFTDISYSFLICNGKIFEGRGWKYQGAHTQRHNDGLGICFIGDFSDILPSQQSISAVRTLIKFGLELGMIDKDYRLYGHRDLKSTLSPGNALYSEIQKWDHYVSNM